MVSYTSKPLPQHPPLDEFGMMLKKTVHWNSGSAYETKSGDRATEDKCRLVADKHMPTNCAAKILHLYNDVLSHGHIPVLAWIGHVLGTKSCTTGMCEFQFLWAKQATLVRWLPPVLHWKLIGKRHVGRPRQPWDHLLRTFGRYKRLGGGNLLPCG